MLEKNYLVTLIAVGVTILMACWHAGNIGRLITMPKDKRQRETLALTIGALLITCALAIWNCTQLVSRVYPTSCADLAAGEYPVKSLVYSTVGGATVSTAYIQMPHDVFKIVTLPSY